MPAPGLVPATATATAKWARRLSRVPARSFRLLKAGPARPRQDPQPSARHRRTAPGREKLARQLGPHQVPEPEAHPPEAP